MRAGSFLLLILYTMPLSLDRICEAFLKANDHIVKGYCIDMYEHKSFIIALAKKSNSQSALIICTPTLT